MSGRWVVLAAVLSWFLLRSRVSPVLPVGGGLPECLFEWEGAENGVAVRSVGEPSNVRIRFVYRPGQVVELRATLDAVLPGQVDLPVGPGAVVSSARVQIPASGVYEVFDSTPVPHDFAVPGEYSFAWFDLSGNLLSQCQGRVRIRAGVIVGGSTVPADPDRFPCFGLRECILERLPS